MPSFAVLVQSLFKKKNKKRANGKLNKEMASTTASSSPSSSSGTNTNSVSHRYDNGRRYQNVEDVAYVLPNDEEENDRIHQQHWLFKIIFNGNFIAPIENELQKGMSVIDVGCGPGTWTLEMAETYPHSRFLGVDISPVYPESIKPANCHFELANIGARLPFPDHHFDYLHQRVLTLGLTAADWDNAFKEHMRVVKPGGWIELTEFDLDIENVGPKMKLIVDAFMSACTLKGLCPRICHELDQRLKALGGNIVDAKIFRVPLNHGGKVGDMFWDDFIQGFMGLRPFMAKAHPEFENEEVYRQYLVDCGEENRQNQANIRMYRVVCQKPAQA